MARTLHADALGCVFCTHRARLKRVAQRILGDAHVAEDLVQDAYVKTLEGCRGFAPVRHPLAYAHRAVRNLALDRLRRSGIEARLFDAGGDAGACVADGGTPESLVMQRQQLALLAGAIAQLPERAQRAFELHRLEGRTQREIGAQLGVSAATVNQWLRLAMLHCRAAVQAVQEL